VSRGAVPFAFQQQIHHMLFAPSQKVWIMPINAKGFEESIHMGHREPAERHQIDEELLDIVLPAYFLGEHLYCFT